MTSPASEENPVFAASASTPGEAVVDGTSLVIRGDWTLSDYEHLKGVVSSTLTNLSRIKSFNLSGLGRLDTAGASQLVSLLGAERLHDLASREGAVAPEKSALLCAVCSAMANRPEPELARVSRLTRFLAETGEKTDGIFQLLKTLNGFIGQTLATLFWVLPRPWRWRVTPFVAAIQETGLNALPIVALLTFLVGAVVAFLGATVLESFGATIYTVNLVTFSFLREFGVLLAAILLAGRTASAFTAHIGAMKVNEELDAIRTLGLNPIEILVLPRVLAMMVSLPILTFVGMIAGIAGGAAVCALSLDIYPAQFLAIVERDTELRHFLVGLSKAPIFAFLIAIIGCLEGFKVSGSAQSVGEHTTSSVVQSIFMVILFDSIAAMFFMEMGW
ncbi:MlaE family ABC transporter permease [Marinobacter albus]|uniref:MlaE family ABC transporter permease n=1 Tax=Marinobacter albus TaxID=3030833 RepID=UPI003CE56A8F